MSERGERTNAKHCGRHAQEDGPPAGAGEDPSRAGRQGSHPTSTRHARRLRNPCRRRDHGNARRAARLVLVDHRARDDRVFDVRCRRHPPRLLAQSLYGLRGVTRASATALFLLGAFTFAYGLALPLVLKRDDAAEIVTELALWASSACPVLLAAMHPRRSWPSRFQGRAIPLVSIWVFLVVLSFPPI